jgi:DNA-binding NtrC family response regulator
MAETLKGKKILIVDDEPDVLEALSELLDMCKIDYAQNFETAEKLLNENYYDAAILDIMGVKGFDLLELTKDRDLPTLILTGHALSPDHLVKSIIRGAFSYIPKSEMVDIATYLDDAIQEKLEDDRRYQSWFRKLKPIFDKKFGPDWLIQYKKDYKRILKNIDLTHPGEDLDKIF